MLEPDTFDRIPRDVPWSIERSYFPSLIERGETFVAYVYDGYWIDIGTPEKYTQVHRDIMDGRFDAARLPASRPAHVVSRADVRVEEGATSKARASSTRACSSRPAPASARTRVHRPQTQIEEDAARRAARSSGRTAASGRTPSCATRSSAATATSAATRTVDGGAVLGDKTTLTDYSRV